MLLAKSTYLTTLRQLLSYTIVILYILFLLSTNELLFQDYPNHLARAYIISDLVFDKGKLFGNLYKFKLILSPYILGDFLLATLIKLFGHVIASKIFVIGAVLSIPISIALYQIARNEYNPLAWLISLYLNMSWFLFVGFLNFLYGIALVFVTLASLEKYLRSLKKYWLIIFYFLTQCTYLMHLAAFVTLGFSSLVYFVIYGMDRNKKPLLLATFSFILPTILYLYTMVFPINKTIKYSWTFDMNIIHKIFRIGAMFVRYSYTIDILLFTLFAFIIWQGIRSQREPLHIKISKSLKKEALKIIGAQLLSSPLLKKRENLIIICGGLFVFYYIAPRNALGVCDVDYRFLPFLFLFMVTIAIPKKAKINFFIVYLLLISNLIYLSTYSLNLNISIKEYLSISKYIPIRARVCSIVTTHDIGRISLYEHLHEYMVISRLIWTPCLFSGSQPGQPMKYFEYLNRPKWIKTHTFRIRSSPQKFPWKCVFETFDYILITKPHYKLKPFLKTKTSLVSENKIVSLYRVVGRK